MNVFLCNRKFHFAGYCSDVKLFGEGGKGQNFLEHRDSVLYLSLGDKLPNSAA